MDMETNREYRYPNNTQTALSYRSFDATTLETEFDIVTYDWKTGTFRTSQQNRKKIRELEKELEDKKRQKESEKKEEEESLKKLIAYYFSR